MVSVILTMGGATVNQVLLGYSVTSVSLATSVSLRTDVKVNYQSSGGGWDIVIKQVYPYTKLQCACINAQVLYYVSESLSHTSLKLSLLFIFVLPQQSVEVKGVQVLHIK